MVVVAIWEKKKIVLKTTKIARCINATVGNYSTLTVVDFQKKVYCNSIRFRE